MTNHSKLNKYELSYFSLDNTLCRNMRKSESHKVWNELMNTYRRTDSDMNDIGQPMSIFSLRICKNDVNLALIVNLSVKLFLVLLICLCSIFKDICQRYLSNFSNEMFLRYFQVLKIE